MTTMTARRIRRGLGVIILALAACGGPPAAENDVSPKPRVSREVLTRSELDGHDELTVFQLVQRLRPSWLRYRGQAVLTSPEREGLRVYLDGSFYGDARAMGQLKVIAVQEIRFLDSRRATMRFGTGHTVGAILITTRRGGSTSPPGPLSAGVRG